MVIRLTWEELDGLTDDQIAELLERHGFHGVPLNCFSCPLANATGWRIYEDEAVIEDDYDPYEPPRILARRKLTEGQRRFVTRFDRGEFPQLIHSCLRGQNE